MKKTLLTIAALVLVIANLAGLTSCSLSDGFFEDVTRLLTGTPKGIVEDVSRGYAEIDFCDFTFSPYYTPVTPRHSYDALTENEKLLYDQLVESVRFVYPESLREEGELYKTRQIILEDMILSEAEVRTAIKAVYDDNPAIFWMSNTFGHLKDQEQNYTAVQLYSMYSPEHIAERVAQVGASADSFFGSVEDGLNSYELEMRVHDYIIDSCVYDTKAAEDRTGKEHTDAYNTYGVMVEHTAVCEGYARTAQLLLNGLGLDCVCVTGMSLGELHMWNALSLGGDWYYLDPTWDDQEEDYQRHNYFNLSLEQMNEDHEPSALNTELTDEEICGDGMINATSMNLFIPQADSTAYNYYVRECVHLTGFDDGTLTDALYACASAGEDYLQFFVDPSYLDFDEAVRLLFSDSPQYFFEYALDVNDVLYDYLLDTENVHYVANENQNVITVKLHYV